MDYGAHAKAMYDSALVVADARFANNNGDDIGSVNVPGHGLAVGDLLKIDDEFFRVKSVQNADTLTLQRPRCNTATESHALGAKIYFQKDDQPHIQAAVNACSAAGGGTVYLPAGTYVVSEGGVFEGRSGGSIVLNRGVTVRGAGPASTIVNGMSAGYSAFVAPAHDSTPAGVNVGVRDLTIGWGGGTVGASNYDGIKFVGAEGVTISNVTVTGATYIKEGITVCGCANVVISNCTVTDTYSMGFSCEDYAGTPYIDTENVVYSYCTVTGSVTGFVLNGPTSGDLLPNVTYEQCTSMGNDRSGFTTYRCTGAHYDTCTSTTNGSAGFYIGDGTTLATLEHCTATGNNLTDQGKAGIDCDPSAAVVQPTNITVDSCVATGNHTGYQEDSACSGTVARGNDFTGNTRPPFYAPSTVHANNLPF